MCTLRENKQRWGQGGHRSKGHFDLKPSHLFYSRILLRLFPSSPNLLGPGADRNLPGPLHRHRHELLEHSLRRVQLPLPDPLLNHRATCLMTTGQSSAIETQKTNRTKSQKDPQGWSSLSSSCGCTAGLGPGQLQNESSMQRLSRPARSWGRSPEADGQDGSLMMMGSHHLSADANCPRASRHRQRHGFLKC